MKDAGFGLAIETRTKYSSVKIEVKMFSDSSKYSLYGLLISGTVSSMVVPMLMSMQTRSTISKAWPAGVSDSKTMVYK
jgi:hypothetical protein